MTTTHKLALLAVALLAASVALIITNAWPHNVADATGLQPDEVRMYQARVCNGLAMTPDADIAAWMVTQYDMAPANAAALVDMTDCR